MAWSELCSGKHTGAVVHSVCCGRPGGLGDLLGGRFGRLGLSESRAVEGSTKAAGSRCALQDHSQCSLSVLRL